MYGLIRQGLPGLTQSGAPTNGSFGWSTVGRTVILLGITSLLTDISAEMVSAVLPLYLLYQLHVSALQLGIVDGLYQGCSGLVRLGAGFLADRYKRQKDVAAAGYGLSAASRLGLMASGGALAGIAAFVLVDRIGKGIRTAPRDALISLSVPRERLGAAFGVHRAFDTGGALLGPLLAFGLLAVAPRAFDVVFLPSFSVALIGLGVIVLFVENRQVDLKGTAITLRLVDCARLLTLPRFRKLVVVAGLLATFTVSDAFIYVGLQHKGSFPIALFPLLYVGTALSYLVLALPAGRLADRLGRRKLFMGGQVLMLLVYTALLIQGFSWVSVAALPLLGAYYASTDGVLMAATSSELDEGMRTSGLALLTTVTSLASLVSSVAVGALWTASGQDATFLCFGIALVLALGVGLWSMRNHD